MAISRSPDSSSREQAAPASAPRPAVKPVKPAAPAAPAPAAKSAKPAKAVKPVTPAKPAGVAAKAAKTVKSGAPMAAKPAVAPQPADVAAAKPARHKEKLVRDSFTMPRTDFALIQQLKDRALAFRHAAKKSELLRAGLHALAGMDSAALQAVLTSLPTLKSGRPKKGS